MQAYEKVPHDGSFLGKGSFGYVEKVRRTRDQKILACKTIWFEDTGTSKAKRECEILKQLKHTNIVRQFEINWRPNQVKIYMEYCEGGSLQHLINERKRKGTLLSEDYVWTIGYQLASAVLYCHAGLRVDGEGYPSSDLKNIPDWKTILHRDIKPANVFMMNRSETAFDSIKLGDFGLGYVLQSGDHAGTYVGTAQFLAPEISRLSADPIHWTTDCDMFSFGCTLYTLCKLRPPFAHHLEAEHESYSPIPDIYSSHLRDLIDSCLSFSPGARPKNALHLFQQCQRRVPRFRDECTSILVPLPTHSDKYTQEFTQPPKRKGRTSRKDPRIPTLLGSMENGGQKSSRRASVRANIVPGFHKDYIPVHRPTGENVDQLRRKDVDRQRRVDLDQLRREDVPQVIQGSYSGHQNLGGIEAKSRYNFLDLTPDDVSSNPYVKPDYSKRSPFWSENPSMYTQIWPTKLV